MRLIPAIDLKDGHCVRLLRGDFGTEIRYGADAQAHLQRYRSYGADWLHVVDLDGARDGYTAKADGGPGNDRPASGHGLAGGHGRNRGILLDLAKQSAVKVQAGGGQRSASAVTELLNAGVARVVIGSLAVTRVDLVRTWLDDFGAERIVLAFDIRLDPTRTPRVAIHGWRDQSQVSLWDAVENFADHEVKHVLCTDVNRDGALSGPNVELYDEAVRRFPDIEWQASGGIRDAGDLKALERAGAKAAISGKALLEERIQFEDLRAFLPNASSPA